MNSRISELAGVLFAPSLIAFLNGNHCLLYLVGVGQPGQFPLFSQTACFLLSLNISAQPQTFHQHTQYLCSLVSSLVFLGSSSLC